MRSLTGLLVAVLLVGRARAMDVTPLPFERVVAEAVSIVHGTVTAVVSERDGSGLPATWVTLAVTECLRGRAEPRITFKQFGLSQPLTDGTLVRLPGVPHYRVGEEVVLFLRAASPRGFTSPVGLGQGLYRVTRTGAAPSVRRSEGGGKPADLDEFLDAVRRRAR